MTETADEIEPETIQEPVEELITKKDPKRVEQGKRLAAISKQAKEAKMRKQINEENFSYFPYIMYSIAILSTSGLVYMLFKGKDDYPMTVIHHEKVPSPKKESPKKERPKKKFENLN